MKEANNRNNSIAKNTIFLYFRTIITMLVTLYTSRLILKNLGVIDYGVYNAVGGFIAIFGVVSGALSNAIGRHITYELGKDNIEKLKLVFCTSIHIQIVIAIIVFVLCELIGLWFLNCKMNIPTDRMIAANWVLHCSLLTFVVNLMSLPYNACLIAHEDMKVYAYISILEAILKLIIVYLLVISPIDKLITYSVLLLVISIIIRLFYIVYCHHYYIETKYNFLFDKKLFIEMINFAGWNFFSNAAYVLNNQGVTLLVNANFGVVMNTSRGIASQVDGAVSQFVNNFSVAVNPQITKSYAVGDYDRLYYLVCKGAKFAYFLLLIFTIPIFYQTEYILNIWLGIVPEHTAMFIKLSLLGALVATLGNSGYTACMATGQIKNYSICITLISSFVFWGSWIAYYFDAPPEATYIVYIFVYIIVQIVRLALMKKLLMFPYEKFVKEVVWKLLMPTILSFSVPYVLSFYFTSQLSHIFCIISISLITTILSIYYLGLTYNERLLIRKKVYSYIHK